jgi:hypothetical protein
VSPARFVGGADGVCADPGAKFIVWEHNLKSGRGERQSPEVIREDELEHPECTGVMIDVCIQQRSGKSHAHAATEVEDELRVVQGYEASGESLRAAVNQRNRHALNASCRRAFICFEQEARFYSLGATAACAVRLRTSGVNLSHRNTKCDDM